MLNNQKNSFMKNLFVVTLTIFNVRTKEIANLDYYFQSFENAEKRHKLFKKDCDNFETFARDWKYSNTSIRKERLED